MLHCNGILKTYKTKEVSTVILNMNHFDVKKYISAQHCDAYSQLCLLFPLLECFQALHSKAVFSIIPLIVWALAKNYK